MRMTAALTTAPPRPAATARATDLDKLAKETVTTILSNKQIVEEKALASNQ